MSNLATGATSLIDFPIEVGILGWVSISVFVLAVVVIVWNLFNKEE